MEGIVFKTYFWDIVGAKLIFFFLKRIAHFLIVSYLRHFVRSNVRIRTAVGMNEEAPLSVWTYALLGVLVAQLRTVFLILAGLALKIFQINQKRWKIESRIDPFKILFFFFKFQMFTLISLSSCSPWANLQFSWKGQGYPSSQALHITVLNESTDWGEVTELGAVPERTGPNLAWLWGCRGVGWWCWNIQFLLPFLHHHKSKDRQNSSLKISKFGIFFQKFQKL